MTASSLAGHNYPGANQAVNTHTIHIPSLWKTGNVKKIFKKYSVSKTKRTISTIPTN